MKLERWQWIALLLLVFFHFGGMGLLDKLVDPNPDRAIDLSSQELESKVMAGMLVLHDQNALVAPKPNDQPGNLNVGESPLRTSYVPEIQEVKPPQIFLFEGRRPRTILLTTSVGCAPCIVVKRNIIAKLNEEAYRRVGWTTTNSKDSALQVVDRAVDPALFNEVVNKINEFNGRPEVRRPKISPMTPTFVRIDRNGNPSEMIVGSIGLTEFLKFSGARN
jgi:hypothetical protein